MLSNMKEIGKRIKNEREKQDLKQSVLANMAKIDSSSLSRYENGFQTPSLESLVSICQALNISLDYIVYGGKKEKLYIQNDKMDDDEELWSECVCYAIASLIEAGVISIHNNDYYQGISLNLYKNIELLEFIRKIENLSNVSDSINDAEYEKAKEKIIDEYKVKIYKDYENYRKFYIYQDYRSIEKYDQKFENILKQLINNHKKII